MPDELDRVIADLQRQRERIDRHIQDLEASKQVTNSIVQSVESLKNRREELGTTGEETIRRINARNGSR